MVKSTAYRHILEFEKRGIHPKNLAIQGVALKVIKDIV